MYSHLVTPNGQATPIARMAPMQQLREEGYNPNHLEYNYQDEQLKARQRAAKLFLMIPTKQLTEATLHEATFTKDRGCLTSVITAHTQSGLKFMTEDTISMTATEFKELTSIASQNSDRITTRIGIYSQLRTLNFERGNADLAFQEAKTALEIANRSMPDIIAQSMEADDGWHVLSAAWENIQSCQQQVNECTDHLTQADNSINSKSKELKSLNLIIEQASASALSHHDSDATSTSLRERYTPHISSAVAPQSSSANDNAPNKFSTSIEGLTDAQEADRFANEFMARSNHIFFSHFNKAHPELSVEEDSKTSTDRHLTFKILQHALCKHSDRIKNVISGNCRALWVIITELYSNVSYAQEQVAFQDFVTTFMKQDESCPSFLRRFENNLNRLQSTGRDLDEPSIVRALISGLADRPDFTNNLDLDQMADNPDYSSVIAQLIRHDTKLLNDNKLRSMYRGDLNIQQRTLASDDRGERGRPRREGKPHERSYVAPEKPTANRTAPQKPPALRQNIRRRSSRLFIPYKDRAADVLKQETPIGNGMCTTEHHNAACPFGSQCKWNHVKKGDNRACPAKYLCHRCGKGGHWWIECPKDKQAAIDYAKFAGQDDSAIDDKDASCAMTFDDVKTMPSNASLMDTGSTHHAFKSRTSFSDIRPLRQPIRIFTPSADPLLDDDEIIATEYGEVTLRLKDTMNQPREIFLKNVLHVPNFDKTNVISVDRLLDDSNGSISIHQDKMKLKMTLPEPFVISIDSLENLYFLYSETTNSDDFTSEALANGSHDDLPLDLPLLTESSDEDGPPAAEESSDNEPSDDEDPTCTNRKDILARLEKNDPKLYEQVDVTNAYFHVPINSPPFAKGFAEFPDHTSDPDTLLDGSKDDPTSTSIYSARKPSLFGKGYSSDNEGDGPSWYGQEVVEHVDRTPPSSNGSEAYDYELHPDDSACRSTHPGLWRGFNAQQFPLHVSQDMPRPMSFMRQLLSCMDYALPDPVREIITVRDHADITAEDCVTIRLSRESGSEQQNIANLVATMQAQRLSPENWNNVTNMLDGEPSNLSINDAINVAEYYRKLLSCVYQGWLTADDLSLFQAMANAADLTTYKFKRSQLRPEFHALLTATDYCNLRPCDIDVIVKSLQNLMITEPPMAAEFPRCYHRHYNPPAHHLIFRQQIAAFGVIPILWIKQLSDVDQLPAHDMRDENPNDDPAPPDDPDANHRAPDPSGPDGDALPSSCGTDPNIVEAPNDDTGVPDKDKWHSSSKSPPGTSIDEHGHEYWWIPIADSTKYIPAPWKACWCNQCDYCASRLYNRCFGWRSCRNSICQTRECSTCIAAINYADNAACLWMYPLCLQLHPRETKNPGFLAAYHLTSLVKSTIEPITTDEWETEGQRIIEYGYNRDHHRGGDLGVTPIPLFIHSEIRVSPTLMQRAHPLYLHNVDNPHHRPKLTKQLIDIGVDLTKHPESWSSSPSQHEHGDYRKAAEAIHLTSPRLADWYRNPPDMKVSPEDEYYSHRRHAACDFLLTIQQVDLLNAQCNRLTRIPWHHFNYLMFNADLKAALIRRMTWQKVYDMETYHRP